MLGLRSIAVSLTTAALLGACSSKHQPAGQAGGREGSVPAPAAAPDRAQSSVPSVKSEPAVSFKEAHLYVETNATDGDAGLQLALDHEPWKSIALYRPDGGQILDIGTQGTLSGYGLTEAFFESSEPSFDKFPLVKFKELFPAGQYRLTGTTVEGQQLESVIALTHDFPGGPKITAPAEDARVPAGALVITWQPVTEPKGIGIVGYQVLIAKEKGGDVFSVELPATATSVQVPAGALESGGEYTLEVLARERNHNQTISERSIKVS
jgi:hypothetical protein